MSAANIASLEELYKSFDGLSMEGGWHRRKPALWPEPTRNLVPHVWRWRDVRPVLDAAGRLVSTEFAERRNLTMTNPAEGNIYPTVRTIVSAYQMMRPGEVARSHRHTPNALRLVLEGNGTYTVVDGKRLEMVPGDVLLTPGWGWHAHGTEGTEDCYWLDFLDVPLVHLLEPMFFERHPDEFEKNVEPVETSPFVFRWSDIQKNLDKAAPDKNGVCERQVELGSPALPTLSLHMQRLTAGKSTSPFRTTANSLYAVAKGSGSTTVDGESFTWSYGDVLALPSWRTFRHKANEPSVLFRVTDEPVMKAFGFLREESVSEPPA